MSDYKSILDKLRTGMGQINEGMKTLSSGPFEFYLTEAEDMIAMLFDRFCPWQIGDRVEITKALDWSKPSAWSCYRHWMVPGAAGRVVAVGAHEGRFTVSVTFDDESWIDSYDGNTLHAIPHRHAFQFDEDYITKL